MTEHRPRVLERYCDVAVIGASAAGLAAGLQLGRQRRSVIVVDSGDPRNAPAAHMHSYLGHEGIPPAQLAAIGREEVRSYGGEVIQGRALDVTRRDDGRFRVELTGGHLLIARRVLAATGLVDVLPEIEGLAEHWGVDVIHCPFCHGYEVRDQRLVQIITHEMGLHPSVLFRNLTTALTVVLHNGVATDHPQLDLLRAAGVTVVDQPVARIVSGQAGRVDAVELVDGTQIEADAVIVGARFTARADVLATLGVTPASHFSGLGTYVQTNETGETVVPGVYAAGNVTDPSQQVLHAAAQGSWVGGMIAFDLARDDANAVARPSANEQDWDHRYADEQIWSGNPNGALVQEVTTLTARGALTPGKALDIGAGEGGDAVWLAEQGWTVSASDISQRGLDRIAKVAHERGLPITTHRVDANAVHAYERTAFDLVSAHYASIPRTPDQRGLRNVVEAVAPGGVLLVVSHDIGPMRNPINVNEHSRPFDADAYIRVEDFRSVLDPSEWTIEIDETRSRPPGAHSHHVDDLILRARRHPA